MKTASHKVSMKMQMHPGSEMQVSAFTRLELVACLCAIALFGAVILPTLASSASRGDRVVCFSNLRQIGVAYGQFGLEHGDLTPWRTSTVQGGNADHPLKNNLSIQFSAISNILATPKLLTDPADQRVGLRPATHWGTGSGGLLSPPIGINGISYSLFLDGGFTLPQAVLAGDRNVRAQTGLACSSGVVPASGIVTPNPWTNDVHGVSGNIVLCDGSVAHVDSEGFTRALNWQLDRIAGTPGNIHLLIP